MTNSINALPKMKENKRLYTISEVADEAGVCSGTVRNWMQRTGMPLIKDPQNKKTLCLDEKMRAYLLATIFANNNEWKRFADVCAALEAIRIICENASKSFNADATRPFKCTIDQIALLRDGKWADAILSYLNDIKNTMERRGCTE